MTGSSRAEAPRRPVLPRLPPEAASPPSSRPGSCTPRTYTLPYTESLPCGTHSISSGTRSACSCTLCRVFFSCRWCPHPLGPERIGILVEALPDGLLPRFLVLQVVEAVAAVAVTTELAASETGTIQLQTLGPRATARLAGANSPLSRFFRWLGPRRHDSFSPANGEVVICIVSLFWIESHGFV